MFVRIFAYIYLFVCLQSVDIFQYQFSKLISVSIFVVRAGGSYHTSLPHARNVVEHEHSKNQDCHGHQKPVNAAHCYLQFFVEDVIAATNKTQ